jgi:hypothetical protein
MTGLQSDRDIVAYWVELLLVALRGGAAPADTPPAGLHELD